MAVMRESAKKSCIEKPSAVPVFSDAHPDKESSRVNEQQRCWLFFITCPCVVSAALSTMPKSDQAKAGSFEHCYTT